MYLCLGSGARLSWTSPSVHLQWPVLPDNYPINRHISTPPIMARHSNLFIRRAHWETLSYVWRPAISVCCFHVGVFHEHLFPNRFCSMPRSSTRHHCPLVDRVSRRNSGSEGTSKLLSYPPNDGECDCLQTPLLRLGILHEGPFQVDTLEFCMEEITTHVR